MSRYEVYKERAKRTRENARHEPIVILVWGPGNPSENASPEKHKAYKKRLEIKKQLKKKFPRAEVFFSEDKEMKKPAQTGQSQLQAEAMQAKNADLILMLDLGRGVDLELDHFIPKYPWFRDKAYVFLPIQYVSTKGLVAEVLDKLESNHIIGFSEQEFKSCKLVTEKAFEVAHTVAMDHYIQR